MFEQIKLFIGRKTRKLSQFSKPILNILFLNGHDRTINVDFQEYLKNIGLFNLHRLYIPIISENCKHFELVIVDISKKKIYYIDPTTRLNVADDIRFSDQRRQDIRNALIAVISVIPGAPVGINWNCECYHASYTYNSYDPLNNDADAGVYLLLILDMLYNDVPLIFRTNDIVHFRRFYMYHLLNDNLAMHC